MRILLMLAAQASLLFATQSSAQTQSRPMQTKLQGTVIHSQSRWGFGHSAIVTESVIERPDSSRITVHQLGGSTGHIGMRISHGMRILAAGDQVNLRVDIASTRRGQIIRRLRGIDRLERAPEPRNLGRKEYVRTTNRSGTHIFWRAGCAFLRVASEGSSQIAGDQEFQVIRDVLNVWQDGSADCSEFQLVSDGTSDNEVGFDGTNLIKFREDTWCRPATDSDPEQCYQESAAGITTLFFVDDASSDRNGEILDADIELNAVQFAFSVGGRSSGSQECKADLANTLTHEIGHFLGLDHTCWVSGTRLEDELGNQIPQCGSPRLPRAVTEATMYNFQACGETEKATLERQDIAGMCAIYPIGEHSTTCQEASAEPAGCCSVATDSRKLPRRGAAGLLLLSALVFFSMTRRTTERRL